MSGSAWLILLALGTVAVVYGCSRLADEWYNLIERGWEEYDK